MDNFEKQQTIETLKTIVKARWFFTSSVLLQGLIVRIVFQSNVPLPNTSIMISIVLGNLFFNFLFWFYLRRPTEKINDPVLLATKLLQVPIDQFGIAALLYFSGTVNKMTIILFFVTYMVAANLYKKKGVAIAAFSGIILFCGLAILEYLGKIKAPVGMEYTHLKPVAGNFIWLRQEIIGFGMYSLSAAIVAGFLAELSRKREKRLEIQKKGLVVQTQELTKTKDYLHEALIKSDKARLELEQTKEELQKANRELQAKIDEIEKYSKVTVGRELKMIELKKKIKELEEKIKELQEKSIQK